MIDRLAVVTIASGRHLHLRRLRRGLLAGSEAPLVHVVVSMGDPDIPAVLAEAGDLPTAVVSLEPEAKLPLARARNVGVATALERGADGVALLDVDCIPEPGLVADYRDLLGTTGPRPAVISGRVRYLPEGLADDDHTAEKMAEVGRDHPARMLPDQPLAEGDPRMLWSLNLGCTGGDWTRIGGFDEGYVGYGGEDTDFGQRLAAAGGVMWWTRRAGVFHQWHPVSSPPVEHVDDIVANANRFRDRWGWYPMTGWLDRFAELGLVEATPDGWIVTA